jgi:dihydroorotase
LEILSLGCVGIFDCGISHFACRRENSKQLMESVLFQNVRIVDRGSPHDGQLADVLVSHGKIARIGERNTLVADNVATGGYLSPGWVDMRVHLTDPGQEQREDLDSLAAAARAGGFTAVLGLPNTHPVLDNAGQIRALLTRAERLPIHLLLAGALSEDAQGKDLAELFDMHQSGALAFTDGRKGTPSAGLLLRGLQYVQPFHGLLISSPIDLSLSDGVMVAEDTAAVRMGLKGIPSIAEEMVIERDLRLLQYFPARLHIGPVTAQGSLELLRAAKIRGLQVTVEASALYFLLDSSDNEAFDPISKVFPPLRDEASVQALRNALAEGLIDVVSSSHHPQGPEEKLHDFADAAFGAESLETAFAALVTGMENIPHEMGALIAALSSNPRRILGLPSATIQVGETAELTHFDPHLAWTPQLSDIRSKSKYNPLIGRPLHGKALGIYAKGAYWKV